MIERLCVLSRRAGAELKYNSKKLLATLPIAFLMIVPPMGASLKPLPNNSDQLIFPATEVADRPNVILATTKAEVVLVDRKISQIVPGESSSGREARLAADEAAAKKRAIIKQAVAVSTAPDPADLNSVYQAAGAAFSVDWRILAAIKQAETGGRGSTNVTNPISGTKGPFQFKAGTFKKHAVDGNGDGLTDIANIWDAAFSAAHYLRACGYPDVNKALWGYNPSVKYRNKVIGLARGFGFPG